MTCRFSLLTLSILMLFAGTAVAASPRYVDVADIAALVKPAVLSTGMADPAFYAHVDVPSPTYTDFFGVQALAGTTRGEILKDFVPQDATLAKEDAHSLTLRFRHGYAMRFFPHSALSVKGTLIPFDHAYVSGLTWRQKQARLAQFRAMLRERGLSARYLVPNPLYYAERIVAHQRATGAPAKIDVDSSLAAFDRNPAAVLLAPEGLHGSGDEYRKLVPILKRHRFDWLGMEMLPSSMQPILDGFSRAPADSPAYRNARARLIEYFAKNWNGRDGPKTTGAENYYFKLADLVRRRHACVIGLEGAPLAYDIFRYGETPAGAAVRSYLWAQTAPADGHGVVFGGSGHFDGEKPSTVEDFMKIRNPARIFVTTVLLRRHAGG